MDWHFSKKELLYIPLAAITTGVLLAYGFYRFTDPVAYEASLQSTIKTEYDRNHDGKLNLEESTRLVEDTGIAHQLTQALERIILCHDESCETGINGDTLTVNWVTLPEQTTLHQELFSN